MISQERSNLMFALSENHQIIVFSRIYPTASDAEKCPKSWKCFWQFWPQLHFAEREGVVKIGITCDLRISRFFSILRMHDTP